MKSISQRIFITLMAVGLLPVLIALLATVTLTNEDALRARQREMRTLSTEMARQIGSLMRGSASNLASMSTNPVLVDGSKSLAEKKEEFNRLVRIYESFAHVSLLDTKGWPLESTDSDYSARQDQTLWFMRAMQGDTVVTEPGIENADSENPRIVFEVYQPILPLEMKDPREARGDPSQGGRDKAKPLGVVRAGVRFDLIWKLLMGASGGNRFILTNDKGKIYYHDKQELLFSELGAEANFTETRDGGGTTTLEGTEFIYQRLVLPANQTMVGREWLLYCLVPHPQAVAIATQSRIHQCLAAGFSLAVAAILGIFLGRRITSHISDTAVAATKVAAGDLETRLPETGPREMAALATAFNHMTKEVKVHREDLERMVEERTRDLRVAREREAALTAQLKAAYEASREAILVLDAEGEIIAANGRVREFFGFDPKAIGAGGASLRERLRGCFTDPEKFSSFWDNLTGDPAATGEDELPLTYPAERILSLFTAPVLTEEGAAFARLWTFRDITERRHLENGLRQAQKMEAVGRLAGGVAHDFNNLLQGILGNIALVELDQMGGAAVERMAMARHAGQRAAQIVKQLLGFSRLSTLHLGACRINEVVKDLHNIVRHTIDPRVQVSVDLDPAAWPLQADSTQIEQVVMNMVVNSRDAMGDRGGLIQVFTRNVTLTPEAVSVMPEGRTGDFVRISVSDNGEGIPPEVLGKIFEPFFTTKEQGKGTGLGLATSFGIVKQHGGWICCDSIQGVGTTFHIFLPRAQGIEVEAPPPAKVDQGPVRGGKETILLVDDEVVVRAVAQSLLKKHGYRVVTADNGEEALAVLGRMDGEIDLVMLDLTMPRLSGRDTFAAMRRGNARNIPVVICSGYMVDLDKFDEETGSRPDAFVQKPYTLDDMARTVREVLDRPVPAKV